MGPTSSNMEGEGGAKVSPGSPAAVVTEAIERVDKVFCGRVSASEKERVRRTLDVVLSLSAILAE